MARLLSIQEVCEILGLSPGALATMRYEGKGPAFHKVTAKQVRYDEADLEAWLATRRQTKTAA